MQDIAPRTKAARRLLIFALFLNNSPTITAHPRPYGGEGAPGASNIVDAGFAKLDSDVRHSINCSMQPWKCAQAKLDSKLTRGANQVAGELENTAERIQDAAHCAAHPWECTKDAVERKTDAALENVKSSMDCLGDPYGCVHAKLAGQIDELQDSLNEKAYKWQDATTDRNDKFGTLHKRAMLVTEFDGDAWRNEDGSLTLDGKVNINTVKGLGGENKIVLIEPDNQHHLDVDPTAFSFGVPSTNQASIVISNPSMIKVNEGSDEADVHLERRFLSAALSGGSLLLEHGPKAIKSVAGLVKKIHKRSIDDDEYNDTDEGSMRKRSPDPPVTSIGMPIMDETRTPKNHRYSSSFNHFESPETELETHGLENPTFLEREGTPPPEHPHSTPPQQDTHTGPKPHEPPVTQPHGAKPEPHAKQPNHLATEHPHMTMHRGTGRFSRIPEMIGAGATAGIIAGTATPAINKGWHWGMQKLGYEKPHSDKKEHTAYVPAPVYPVPGVVEAMPVSARMKRDKLAEDASSDSTASADEEEDEEAEALQKRDPDGKFTVFLATAKKKGLSKGGKLAMASMLGAGGTVLAHKLGLWGNSSKRKDEPKYSRPSEEQPMRLVTASSSEDRRIPVETQKNSVNSPFLHTEGAESGSFEARAEEPDASVNFDTARESNDFDNNNSHMRFRQRYRHHLADDDDAVLLRRRALKKSTVLKLGAASAIGAGIAGMSVHGYRKAYPRNPNEKLDPKNMPLFRRSEVDEDATDDFDARALTHSHIAEEDEIDEDLRKRDESPEQPPRLDGEGSRSSRTGPEQPHITPPETPHETIHSGPNEPHPHAANGAKGMVKGYSKMQKFTGGLAVIGSLAAAGTWAYNHLYPKTTTVPESVDPSIPVQKRSIDEVEDKADGLLEQPSSTRMVKRIIRASNKAMQGDALRLHRREEPEKASDDPEADHAEGGVSTVILNGADKGEDLKSETINSTVHTMEKSHDTEANQHENTVTIKMQIIPLSLQGVDAKEHGFTVMKQTPKLPTLTLLNGNSLETTAKEGPKIISSMQSDSPLSAFMKLFGTNDQESKPDRQRFVLPLSQLQPLLAI